MTFTVYCAVPGLEGGVGKGQTITEECHGGGHRAVEPDFQEAEELPAMNSSCGVNSGGKILDRMPGHQSGQFAVPCIPHAPEQGRADIYLVHPSHDIVTRVDCFNQPADIIHQYQYSNRSISRAGLDGGTLNYLWSKPGG